MYNGQEDLQNKTFQPQPVGLFQALLKLHNYIEKIVFVISHVRVIVLMVFTVKSSMILFDDPKFVEFIKGCVFFFHLLFTSVFLVDSTVIIYINMNTLYKYIE